MAENAMTETYDEIEIFGKTGLFSNFRIDKDTLPDGWHAYDVRGSDYDPGEFASLEKSVGVNHAGTVIFPFEIEIEEHETGGAYNVIKDYSFTDNSEITIDDFRAIRGIAI